MYKLKLLWMTLCMLSIALAGCAPPAATPAVTDTPTATVTATATVTPTPSVTETPVRTVPPRCNPGTGPVNYKFLYAADGCALGIKAAGRQTTDEFAQGRRGEACARYLPLQPGNYLETAAATNPPEERILWTFILNFDQWAGGQPLACLRLFRRLDAGAVLGSTTVTTDTFEAIDGGGILLDTCTVFSTQPPTPMVITLESGDQVGCELDLVGWVTALVSAQALVDPAPSYTSTLGYMSDELASFVRTSTHIYEALTIAAAAKTSERQNTGAPDVTPQRLVCYDNCLAALWVYVDREGGLWWPEPCASPTPPMPNDPRPTSHAQFIPDYFWDDVNHSGETYTVERFKPDDLAALDYARCSYTSPRTSIELPIGPITIWVGSDDLSNSFLGDIDVIIIDPTDSRPPGMSLTR